MMDDCFAGYASVSVVLPIAAVKAEAVEPEKMSLPAASLSDESCSVGKHLGGLAR
jgi:hypothetical protein